MKRGEALVTSTNVVTALDLKVGEKLAHLVGCEILDRESGNLTMMLVSDECEEEPQRVADAGLNPFSAFKCRSKNAKTREPTAVMARLPSRAARRSA